MDSTVKRVEEAANKLLCEAWGLGWSPAAVDLSDIIPDGWEYELIEAYGQTPTIKITLTG